MASDPLSFKRLTDIGIALSSEKDSDRLMERILLEAKAMGNADGGTLYIRTKDDQLQFTILRTDSLQYAQGGTSGQAISLPPVEMFIDGKPNLRTNVSFVANSSETINIGDAYVADKFDFTGTKKFDAATGYLSKSFLTVPLKNNAGRVIGVLQLLDSLDPETGEVVAFPEETQPVIEALASQAAVSIENRNLIESQKQLLDSFIELMASAVDAKSPYTGGHCQRVPELTEMLTRAACESNEAFLADFNLNEEQWYELHIGAWLHDCGKVTTPDYIVDKATKLETITDRIHEVRMRFELLKTERTIAYRQVLLAGTSDEAGLKTQYEADLKQIGEDFEFIAECNLGSEFMADEKVQRLKRIAKQQWTQTLDDRLGVSFDEARRKGKTPSADLPQRVPVLDDRPDHIIEHDGIVQSANPANPYGFKIEVPAHKYNRGEVYNLAVAKGTLTAEERFKINDHIVQTIVMLENLPFPKNLERVAEIAGGHHEKMDGTGYPKKLRGDEMSIPARVMAIADVFEALTAADRPYKPPKKLSESIRIMSVMVKDHHLDPDLFKLFLTRCVWLCFFIQAISAATWVAAELPSACR